MEEPKFRFEYPDLGHFLRQVHKRLGRIESAIDAQLGSNRELRGAVMAQRVAIQSLQRAFIIEGEKMALNLDALEQEVARNTTVDESAITLLTGLAAKIEELKADPVKLQAFADSLRASSDSLATAVAANTPAEPPAEPPTT